MIKFFRKIRQKLIDEGNLKKYLVYSIGEILLVVIGILIALEINNRNEWRKDRAKEKIILEDLENNIKINIQTFQDDIELLQEWNHASDIVIRALENKWEYSDSLKHYFHLARVTKQNLFLSNVGYQAYKDEGLGIITNKTLSTEIIKLYETTMPSTLSTNNLVNVTYSEWDNYIVQNFEYIEGEGLTPYNYEALITAHFYSSWIKAYNQGRVYLMETDKKLIKECKRVLQLIQDELN